MRGVSKVTRASTWGTHVVVLVALLLSFNSGPAFADPKKDELKVLSEAHEGEPTCLEEFEAFRPSAVSEVAAVVAKVREACKNETSCGTPDLIRIIDEAVTIRPSKTRKWLKKILLIPRRILLFGIYGVAVIGPPLLTLYVASKFEMEQTQKLVLSGAVTAMSGFLLGRFGASLERMMGPHLEQFAMMIWAPHEGDSWGRIQQALNEKDRLIASQVYNQVMLYAPHFLTAGEAVRRKNFAKAAEQYAITLLHSVSLFGGLNYFHPAMIRAVRGHLPKSGEFRDQIEMTLDEKMELIIRVCRTIQEKPEDEMPAGIPRDQLVRFAFGVMIKWLVIHQDPVPQPAVSIPIVPLPAAGNG